MEYYPIKKIFKGETVYILGGGASLLNILGDQTIPNPTIGINNAFRLGDWVDVCWFVDSRFYWWYKKELDAYKGLKLSYNRHPELLGSLEYIEGVKTVKGSSGEGISLQGIKFNSSSGGSSINLAYLLGAKKIVLVGFDMRFVNSKSNWWDYSNHMLVREKGYDNFIKPFHRLKKDADMLGLEILNATPGSALDMFKFVRLDENFKRT